MMNTSDIKKLRDDLKETQWQFAKRFHVTRQAIYNWENRSLPTNVFTLKALERLRARTPVGGKSGKDRKGSSSDR